jgi:aspartyl/asparaginyl beta-hydroxylase (cupin superfamily)
MGESCAYVLQYKYINRVNTKAENTNTVTFLDLHRPSNAKPRSGFEHQRVEPSFAGNDV